MTALFKKLNYKSQKQIVVINAPESFKDELYTMQKEADIIIDVDMVEKIEFAICFVTKQSEIEQFLFATKDKWLGDVIIWISYPKGSSKKYKCDFNRDSGFDVLGNYGFEGVRQIAIDNDWSALRFRKEKFIKTITRKHTFALTKEAKERTTYKN